MDGDIGMYLLPEPESPEFAFAQWEGRVDSAASLLKASPGPCVLCGAPDTACTHEATEGVVPTYAN